MNGQSILDCSHGAVRRRLLLGCFEAVLLADQNQNACHQRQNSDHDGADGNMKKRSDPNKNQIDGEQQHSNVFCHPSFSEATPMRLHAQKDFPQPRNRRRQQ